MLRILFVLTDLVAPLACGYFLKQHHLLSQRVNDCLIRFNIIIVNTLLALLAFWVLPLDRSLLIAPLFGCFLVLFPGLIGYALFARRLKSPLDRGAYMGSALLANLGTLGGVCAFILYNEQGFAYAQLVATIQNFLLCIVIFPIAQYYHMKATGSHRQTSRLRSLRDMFLSPNQLCVLGMAAGLALNALGIERPAPLGTLFQSLVHIGAWSAMLPVGFFIDLRTTRRYLPHIHSLTALRFLITPAATLLLATLLPLDPILRNTIIILSFAPTAINAVLSARLYRLNVNLPAASFLVTTAAFLLIIFPILFFLLR